MKRATLEGVMNWPGPHLAMNSAAVITCSLLLNQELLALAGRALEADFS
jgi:hypothetical protein